LSLFRPLRRYNYGNVAVLVITIGLSIFLRHIYLLFASARPASYPLDLQKRQDYFGIQLTPRNVQVLIIGSVVMILVGLFLSYTKTGKAMRAVRDSSELASVSGINSDYIITLTWIFSSMLAGFTGIIQGVINNVRWNMGFLILLLIFAGSILGGIGTSFGAMFGGFIIGMLVQLSVGLSFMDGHTEAKNAIALALMIIILLIRPQGIFGSKERIS
jgi:branched-chain amino acid transport system permease protein